MDHTMLILLGLTFISGICGSIFHRSEEAFLPVYSIEQELLDGTYINNISSTKNDSNHSSVPGEWTQIISNIASPALFLSLANSGLPVAEALSDVGQPQSKRPAIQKGEDQLQAKGLSTPGSPDLIYLSSTSSDYLTTPESEATDIYRTRKPLLSTLEPSTIAISSKERPKVTSSQFNIVVNEPKQPSVIDRNVLPWKNMPSQQEMKPIVQTVTSNSVNKSVEPTNAYPELSNIEDERKSDSRPKVLYFLLPRNEFLVASNIATDIPLNQLPLEARLSDTDLVPFSDTSVPPTSELDIKTANLHIDANGGANEFKSTIIQPSIQAEEKQQNLADGSSTVRPEHSLVQSESEQQNPTNRETDVASIQETRERVQPQEEQQDESISLLRPEESNLQQQNTQQLTGTINVDITQPNIQFKDQQIPESLNIGETLLNVRPEIWPLSHPGDVLQVPGVVNIGQGLDGIGTQANIQFREQQVPEIVSVRSPESPLSTQSQGEQQASTSANSNQTPNPSKETQSNEQYQEQQQVQITSNNDEDIFILPFQSSKAQQIESQPNAGIPELHLGSAVNILSVLS